MDEWLAIYEQWEADPDPAYDVSWVEKLAGVATLHGLACYENGVDDAGAAGWRRLVESYRGGGVYGLGVTQEATDDKRQTKNELPRALPWETK